MWSNRASFSPRVCCGCSGPNPVSSREFVTAQAMERFIEQLQRAAGYVDWILKDEEAGWPLRCRFQRSTSSLSTSRPRRHWVLGSRRHWCLGPTRSLNEAAEFLALCCRDGCVAARGASRHEISSSYSLAARASLSTLIGVLSLPPRREFAAGGEVSVSGATVFVVLTPATTRPRYAASITCKRAADCTRRMSGTFRAKTASFKSTGSRKGQSSSDPSRAPYWRTGCESMPSDDDPSEPSCNHYTFSAHNRAHQTC